MPLDNGSGFLSDNDQYDAKITWLDGYRRNYPSKRVINNDYRRREIPERYSEAINDLKDQIEDQKTNLIKSCVLTKYDFGLNGEKWVYPGIDNRNHAFPQESEIVRKLKHNKELIAEKHEQGFTKLLVIPALATIRKLVFNYRQALLKKYREGLKFYNNSYKKILNLNNLGDKPVNIWHKIYEADENNQISYYPKKISRILNGGITKKQLSAEGQSWRLALVKPQSLSQFENETVNPKVIFSDKFFRRNTEINNSENLPLMSPRIFLSKLAKNPETAGEAGMSIEDALIYAIAYLEEKNMIINDWITGSGDQWQSGSGVWLTGSLLKNFDNQEEIYIPKYFWHNSLGTAYIHTSRVNHIDKSCSYPTIVELK